MSKGRIVEFLDIDRLRSFSSDHRYTTQLLTASRGYDRAQVDQFEDFE